MDRLISGVSPISDHKGKRVTSRGIIKCDDDLYEDIETLIQAFYDNREWFNLKGDIVAIDHDVKTFYSRLVVWTQDSDCDCGNMEKRDSQYDKDEPQDDPVCAWHSSDFDYTTVYLACRW
jgi:hypothetical protein